MKHRRFWEWVCNRRAHDNPRGDFVRDTRYLMECARDPNEHLWGPGTWEAREEYRKLVQQYQRQHKKRNF